MKLLKRKTNMVIIKFKTTCELFAAVQQNILLLQIFTYILFFTGIRYKFWHFRIIPIAICSIIYITFMLCFAYVCKYIFKFLFTYWICFKILYSHIYISLISSITYILHDRPTGLSTAFRFLYVPAHVQQSR